MFIIGKPMIVLNTPCFQLSAVKSLHSQHYVHYNIKPTKFIIHINNIIYPTIFLIDFGLAELFHNPITYLHTPFITDHLIIGTILFTSINA